MVKADTISRIVLTQKERFFSLFVLKSIFRVLYSLLSSSVRLVLFTVHFHPVPSCVAPREINRILELQSLSKSIIPHKTIAMPVRASDKCHGHSIEVPRPEYIRISSVLFIVHYCHVAGFPYPSLLTLFRSAYYFCFSFCLLPPLIPVTYCLFKHAYILGVTTQSQAANSKDRTKDKIKFNFY